ncbi:MAG TPA: hypothetical protein VGQ00_01735 [Candidatus Norongarragalinales archaeon]|jgi:hypothetical protein|nr:hypothetical protein [Candidatus Norongarragalinales archaeon]
MIQRTLKSYALRLLALVLSLAPFARADVIDGDGFMKGFLYQFLPFTIIGAIVAFLLAKKYFKIKLSFWNALLMYAAASLVSISINTALAPHASYGSITPFDNTSRGIETVSNLIAVYIVSVIVSLPVIYLFIKKDVKKKLWQTVLLMSAVPNLAAIVLFALLFSGTFIFF